MIKSFKLLSIFLVGTLLSLELQAMDDTLIANQLRAEHFELHRKKIAEVRERDPINSRVITTTKTYTPKGNYVGAERWIITMQTRKLGKINHIKFNNKTRGSVSRSATDRSDIFITFLTKIKFDSDRCENAPSIWEVNKSGKKLEVLANLVGEETDLTIEFPRTSYYDVTFEYPDGACVKAVRAH